MASTTPERPPRVPIEVGTKSIVFVRVEGDRYAAEVDGTRRSIRLRRLEMPAYQSSAGEPVVTEGETADIDPILRCLELHAQRKPLAGPTPP